MRIIFAGTPEFAVPSLQMLLDSKHEVCGVYTQPDRPAGRGRHTTASPVKELAIKAGIAVFQPDTLKTDADFRQISSLNADLIVVVAYGMILTQAVLDLPKFGCINVHGSLLPRWRGAAPIHRSILAGDKETGVTIMEVVPALDAGAMVSKGVVPITETDTTQGLHDALAAIGADLMVEAMHVLTQTGQLASVPQDELLVTYAHKLEKAEAVIDWQKSAAEISRQVRAFNPFPVAQSFLHGEVCRLWMATTVDGMSSSAAPGSVLDVHDGILVACGDGGVLRISELQAPGGKRLSASVFMQGHALKAGDQFGGA